MVTFIFIYVNNGFRYFFDARRDVPAWYREEGGEEGKGKK
jgi:hypothetical protein